MSSEDFDPFKKNQDLVDVGEEEESTEYSYEEEKVEKKQKKGKKGEAEDGEERPGVIYIGHIPHGFYEIQMKEYFSQFGTVTHVKVSRNTKVSGFFPFSQVIKSIFISFKIITDKRIKRVRFREVRF